MSCPTAPDRAALARAVVIAESARATTSPNPAVGAVVVADGGRVVAEGVTAPVGGPHAEVAALAAAGPAARGATLAVTLEPCVHQGRTPPCTDAILRAGVARVLIGHPDPDPVAAGGAEQLRSAGVEVTGPLVVGDPLRGAIAEQLEGFLHRVRTGRPHVTLKLAQTWDGQLVAPAGERWITGPAARRAVHRWRAGVDAVLVGAGTVLADDPRLDVRAVASPRQPRPVVFDGRLRTPPDAAVVARRALIVTAGDHPHTVVRRLEDAGAVVVGVPAGRDGGVDPDAALRAVAATGVTSVLAEPGATLAGALIAGGLVDRLVLHVATADRRGWFVPAVEPQPGRRWSVQRLGGAGSDLVLHLGVEAVGTPDAVPLEDTTPVQAAADRPDDGPGAGRPGPGHDCEEAA